MRANKSVKVKPVVKTSKNPTLELGRLNACYCPRCGIHLFSYYDEDFKKMPHMLSNGWNYCSRCGLHLNFDEYKDSSFEQYNSFTGSQGWEDEWAIISQTQRGSIEAFSKRPLKMRNSHPILNQITS